MNATISHAHTDSDARAHVTFASFVILSAIVSLRVLSSLISYSLAEESASHIILVPLISAFLLFMERRRIFSVIRPSILPGAALILVGLGLLWRSTSGPLWQLRTENLSLAVLALFFIWVGAFVWSYGWIPTRAAGFPLLFLILMVPLPEAALAWSIHALQEGSTDVAYFFFKLLGVPVFREGFILSVPTVTIRVAVECSGIRSSIALLITCLLAAHFYLRTPWKIAFFLLLVAPLTVIKNGIRIATLTLLSIYVNPSFLHGRLHHDGGFVFFALGLVLLLPVLLLLQRSEHGSGSPANPNVKQALS